MNIIGAYRAAFAGLERTVWLLCLITFVHRSGTMVLPFLSLYLTTRLEASASQAGQILGVYGIGAVVGAYLGGLVSDRLGPMPTQALALVLAGLGFFSMGQVDSLPMLTLMIFLTSIAAEGFRPPNAAALAELASDATRVRAFALRRLAINLGMTAGPAVGGFLAANYDYQWLFWCDGGTCLVAAVVLLTTLGTRRRATNGSDEPASAAALVSPWHDRFYLAILALTLLLSTVFYQVFGPYPLTLHLDYGHPENVIGLLMAINTLLIVAFEMVLVHAVGRFAPLRVVGPGAFLLTLGLALVPLGSSFAYLAFTVIVFTCGEMLSMPILEGFVAGYAPQKDRGRYLGLYTAAYSAAFVFAPAVGMAIYESYGHQVLWFACGGVGLLVWLGFDRLGHAHRTSQPDGISHV